MNRFIALSLLLSSPVLGQFSDNFDSYANGSGINGQGGWEVWCTGGSDASVSNLFASSGANSLQINTGSDIVHQFTGVNSGKWTFSIMTYVPSNAGGTGEIDGWVNLMNTYCPSVNGHWSTATKFSLAFQSVITWGALSVPLATDKWAEYRVEIDFDTDTYGEFYDGAVLSSGLSWTSTVGAGGVLTCVAVDLFASAIDGMHFDDVSLQPKAGGCYADCDLSGGLDFFDFLCFQNEFASSTAYADCDMSGGLDFFDFLCFQNAFAAGCP